jgi:hypothetical protein
MYKVTDQEVLDVLEECTDQITEMIIGYKYTNKIESLIPTIEVYPVGDNGFIALFKHDTDVLGSVVNIGEDCIFTSYGNDSDLMH